MVSLAAAAAAAANLEPPTLDPEMAPRAARAARGGIQGRKRAKDGRNLSQTPLPLEHRRRGRVLIAQVEKQTRIRIWKGKRKRMVISSLPVLVPALSTRETE
jgi:hypothetical protein